MKYPHLVSAIVASIISVSLAGCGSSSPSAPSPTFTALPYAGADFASSYALAISPDGKTIGGGSLVSQAETGPVLWVNGKVQVLPFMGPAIPDMVRVASVTAVSASGVVAGNQGYADLIPIAYYYKAAVWTQIVNPANAAPAITAGAISSDGNVIVGLIDGNKEAPADDPERGGYYLDIEADKFVVIASSYTIDKDCTVNEDCYTQFSGLSGDGSLAVGSDSYSPGLLEVPIVYELGASSPPVRLALPFNYQHGRAMKISQDGKTILGMAFDNLTAAIAVYWDENYQVHVIGSLGPDTHPMPQTTALAASDKGARIVGTSNNKAFLWEAGGQIADLQDWLTAQGLGSQLKDWELLTATGISSDGHQVAGVGIAPGGYTTAFQVYLP